MKMLELKELTAQGNKVMSFRLIKIKVFQVSGKKMFPKKLQ